jgi:hypothetical protein
MQKTTSCTSLDAGLPGFRYLDMNENFLNLKTGIWASCCLVVLESADGVSDVCAMTLFVTLVLIAGQPIV